MALAQRKLEIPLFGGIDSETADKLLPLGFGLELENCQYAKKGEIEKRPGFAAMAMATVDGGAVPPIWQLATHKGSLVALGKSGEKPISVYSPARAKWTLSTSNADTVAVRSQLRGPVKVTTLPIGSGPYNHFTPDVCFINYGTGYLGVAHYVNDAAQSTAVTVIDAVSERRLFDYRVAGTALFQRGLNRVFSVGSFFVAVYYEAGSLKLISFDLSVASPAASLQTITANASNVAGVYEIAKKSATVWTVFYRTTSNAMAGRDITVVGSVSIGAEYAVQTAAAGTINPSMGIGVVEDLSGSGFRVLLESSLAAGVRAHYINASNVTTKTLVIDAAAITNVFQLTGFTVDSDPHIHVMFDVLASPGYNTKIRLATVTGADVVTVVDWERSVSLSSKPFRYNGSNYVAARFTSNTQPTEFLLRVPATTADVVEKSPQARWHTWTSGAELTASKLASVWVSADSRLFYGVAAKKTRVASSSAATFLESGIDVLKFEFDPVVGKPVEYNDMLLVPTGGQLGAFDGRDFSDFGFPVYPEPPTLAESNTAGGALTLTGVYTYCLVYSWLDHNAALHRSAVSFTTGITLTGANDTVTVTCPTLRILGTAGSGGRVMNIEVYRNESNGVTFYKVGSVVNDPTVDTVAFVDDDADTAIIAGELLYASGGVLEYDPPPGALAVCVHKDKTFLISSENPDEVWYSNVTIAGRGPRWSEAKVIRVSDGQGAGVALASDGTNVYLWKGAAVYLLVGEGTDTLGRGAPITYQQVETGLGTTNPQSVVVTPQGPMFKAAAGIYLKPGGAPAAHVGGPMQAYNGLTIVAAVLHPDKNQVRFHTSTNRTLVLNYRYNRWSTFTGTQTATAAVVWGTTPVFANGSTVYKEDVAIFTDAAAAYEQAVATSWLSLAGLKGWQYTWTLQGAGERVGDHTLQVKVFNDQDDATPTQTKTAVIGAGHKWDWELPIKRGMSASMKVRLSDQSAANGGFKASLLVLLYGVMGGLQRVAPSKRMT